jgi:uncharacterized membrane protein
MSAALIDSRAARRTPSVRSLLVAFLAGLVAAEILVALVYGLARWAGDPLLVAPPGQASQAVNLGMSLAAGLVGALVGLVGALVARATPRPRPVFVAAAVLGLLLSFASPFSASSGATPLWLSAMHVAVAAGVVPALARALPDRKA